MGTRFKYVILPDYEKKEFNPQGHAGIESEAEKGKRFRPRGYIARSSSSRHVSGGGSHRQDSSKQLVYFNAKYRINKDLHAKHLQYIQKEGKGKDGEKPLLYGNDPQHYEKKMAKLHYRFIISPENQNVNLTVLVNEFIHQLEHRTGYEFDWVAANHYNTGQQHAHILINGFDKHRRKIKFSRDEMKNLMRSSLSRMITTMVGPRTPYEKEQALQNQSRRNGYTHLDESLKSLEKNQTISLYPLLHSPNGTIYHKRMMYLCKLGLAQYDFTHEHFIMQANWQDMLKIASRYNSYLEGFQFTKVHPSQYRFHDVRKDGPISGVIVKKYYMQDNANDHSVILQTSPTTYAFVPLQFALSDFGVGQTVHIAHNTHITTGGKAKGETEVRLISP
jgi:hypothetical protein